jgi:hypothetical protein
MSVRRTSLRLSRFGIGAVVLRAAVVVVGSLDAAADLIAAVAQPAGVDLARGAGDQFEQPGLRCFGLGRVS